MTEYVSVGCQIVAELRPHFIYYQSHIYCIEKYEECGYYQPSSVDHFHFYCNIKSNQTTSDDNNSKVQPRVVEIICINRINNSTFMTDITSIYYFKRKFIYLFKRHLLQNFSEYRSPYGSVCC